MSWGTKPAEVFANKLHKAVTDEGLFARVEIVGEVTAYLGKLESDLIWVAQTVHQAYHLEQSGTWRECPKSTCDAVKQVIEYGEKHSGLIQQEDNSKS